MPNATERQSLALPVKRLLNYCKQLELKESCVVCRNVQDSQTLETLQHIITPATQAKSLWEAYHQQAGHPGLERILSLLKRNFYWAQMEEAVHTWIQACPHCVLHKARPEGKAPLVPIILKAPMHIVAVDFLMLGHPTDRYQNMLVMTDMFAKFAWAPLHTKQPQQQSGLYGLMLSSHLAVPKSFTRTKALISS